MEKNCFTTREQFYHVAREGDVVFDNECATVERVEGKLTIKIRMPKCFNWKQLATAVRCETQEISQWGLDLMKEGKKSWDELPVIISDEVFDDEELDESENGAESIAGNEATQGFIVDDDYPEVFMYMYDDNNWVMYESDDEYLFLYELHSGQHALTAGDIEAVSFNPNDEVAGILSFLLGWYDRVNGYKKEED